MCPPGVNVRYGGPDTVSLAEGIRTLFIHTGISVAASSVPVVDQITIEVLF